MPEEFHNLRGSNPTILDREAIAAS